MQWLLWLRPLLTVLHIFLWKFWLLQPPPLRILLAFLGVGMNDFQNCTLPHPLDGYATHHMVNPSVKFAGSHSYRHLGGERQCETKVSFSRTQNIPDQDSKPGLLDLEVSEVTAPLWTAYCNHLIFILLVALNSLHQCMWPQQRNGLLHCRF